MIGLMVSFAFYNAAGLGDVASSLADIAYGVIMELVAQKYEELPVCYW